MGLLCGYEHYGPSFQAPVTTVPAMAPDPDVTQFTDCLLLRDHELVREDLWVQGGKIINPGPLFFQSRRNASKKVKCHGNILAPGFIDLQINGAFGLDFT